MGILDKDELPDAPPLPVPALVADLRARMVQQIADVHFLGEGGRADLLKKPMYDHVMREAERIAEHFDRAVEILREEVVKARVSALTTPKA
ncbi:MAG TPA: hypothetical protein PK788_07675 [Gemmatimonadaceae bacterium]|nr:hypothetical protein [Gemmatimonadaceae bacterium]